MENIRKIVREKLFDLFENYPIGMDFDFFNPWNKNDYTGEKLDSFTPNYKLGGFNIVLNDGEEVFIDYENIMEMYYKSNPNSFDLLSDMFSESDRAYADQVNYLIGQGYVFTDLIQDEVDRRIENGTISSGEEKEFNREYSVEEEGGGLYENFLIFKTEILPGTHVPNHTIIDKADSEDEAEQKVKTLEIINPEDIYYFDRNQAIQSKHNLN